MNHPWENRTNWAIEKAISRRRVRLYLCLAVLLLVVCLVLLARSF